MNRWAGWFARRAMAAGFLCFVLGGAESVFAAPDVATTAVSGPTSGVTGENITISNTVTNQGTWSADFFSIGLYLSKDPTISINGEAGYSQVAIDPSGNAMAIWQQFDGAYLSILANRYAAGAGWGEAEFIEINAEDAYDPDVVVNGSGTAVAVWTGRIGNLYSIWANRYEAGPGWGTPFRIVSMEAFLVTPQVGVDDGGNAIVIWEQADHGAGYNIYASRYEMGSGWGLPVLIENNPGYAFSPRLAMNGNGNAVAVWEQQSSSFTNPRVSVNRYEVGVGWGTAAMIQANPADASSPEVVIGADGHAIVVWSESNGVSSDIWASRYETGMGWGTAGLIESNAGDAGGASVAMDESGNAVAVWIQNDGLFNSIWANRYEAGLGWGVAALIESNSANVGGLSVGMSGSGYAAVVWQQDDTMFNNIWMNRYLPGTGWEGANPIDTQSGGVSFPDVAVDGSGNAVLVAERSDGSSFFPHVWGNRYAVGAGWGTGFVVSTPLDIFLGSRWVDVLDAGASSSDNTVVTIPDVPAGTYYLGAVADDTQQVPEDVESNNPLAGNTILVVGPPSVSTGGAADITPTSATLNGTANPNGLTGTAWFEYGPTTSYGFTSAAQAISGSTPNDVSIPVAGLTPNALYHYRIVAQNGGTRYGADATFTTLGSQDRLPVSHVNVQSAWSRTGCGKTTYQCVDDPIGGPNNGADYIRATRSGKYAVFGFSPFAVPPGETIRYVRVTYVAIANSAGTDIKAVLRVGNADYAQATPQTLSSAWTAHHLDWTANPGTGQPWTVADVNGTGANPLTGMGVLSGSGDASVTQVYVTVAYE